jgi:hypothetical protein
MTKDQLEGAFNRAVARLGELFAYKQLIRDVGGQQAGLERYRITFSGQTFSELNELLHDLGVAIRRYSGHEPPAECKHCDELIGERDRAQDALQETHIALGGDGEWKGKLPPEPAPNSGDLHLDVPELAREIMSERSTHASPALPTWQCPNCDTVDEFSVKHEVLEGGAVLPVVECHACSDKLSYSIEKDTPRLSQPPGCNHGPDLGCSKCPHSDDIAVDRFAVAMKTKLERKRAEGRSGWDDPEQCSVVDLERMLHEHVTKGDPVDIGNFAMMLWNRFKAWDDAARSRPTKGEAP